ncbi:MAG: OmpA family protein [Candidatus Eisenbacteria bacterium]|uniref:OmpA family protein n=1 Tax=Eiseniibacteriota bacterium TaxID=2212470 RepID=A0A956SD43_UNCEI|nr:OmpA family protein [Candidatus Eisenbacteria bacterium]MCB9464093.1 OmpA family protein [Candidatus Eisenbacteria bacterium]
MSTGHAFSRSKGHPFHFVLLAVGFLAMALLGAGCAGSRPDLTASLDQFDRYADEVRRMEPEAGAQDVLGAGTERRNIAAREAESGDGKVAQMEMNMALADAEVALAMSQMEQAQRRADHCLRELEQTRRGWEEAFYVLEQTESVVSRVAPLSRQRPELPEPLPLPESRFEADMAVTPPDVLVQAWDEWKGAAEAGNVSLVDLEGEFDRRIAAARVDKASTEERGYHLHIAGRLLQEAECRVRTDVAHQSCVQATTLAARLAESRDAALKATLELERGLQDDLRAELDKTRMEARSRQDDLYDALGQLEGKYAKISQDARGTILSLADILFDFGKATLKRDVEFALVRVATILNQFSEMSVGIEGHTDNIGSEAYNQELSERRAEAVYDFLVEQGVDAARMTHRGFGFSRPVADNATDEGRQRNRRVDLVIQDRSN